MTERQDMMSEEDLIGDLTGAEADHTSWAAPIGSFGWVSGIVVVVLNTIGFSKIPSVCKYRYTSFNVQMWIYFFKE